MEDQERLQAVAQTDPGVPDEDAGELSDSGLPSLSALLAAKVPDSDEDDEAWARSAPPCVQLTFDWNQKLSAAALTCSLGSYLRGNQGGPAGTAPPGCALLPLAAQRGSGPNPLPLLHSPPMQPTAGASCAPYTAAVATAISGAPSGHGFLSSRQSAVAGGQASTAQSMQADTHAPFARHPWDPVCNSDLGYMDPGLLPGGPPAVRLRGHTADAVAARTHAAQPQRATHGQQPEQQQQQLPQPQPQQLQPQPLQQPPQQQQPQPLQQPPQQQQPQPLQQPPRQLQPQPLQQPPQPQQPQPLQQPPQQQLQQRLPLPPVPQPLQQPQPWPRDLVSHLELHPTQPLSKTRFENIGRFLLGVEAAAAVAVPQLARKFIDNPDPSCRQFAFLAVGGKLDNERSNLGGTTSGRQCVPVYGNGGGDAFIACLYGDRCTCDKTYDDDCKKDRHPHDKVTKYFLVYRNPPPHCVSTPKRFKVSKKVARLLTGASSAPPPASSRRSTSWDVAQQQANVDPDPEVWLWEPEEHGAVLWHIKERVVPQQQQQQQQQSRKAKRRKVPPVAAPAEASAAAAADEVEALRRHAADQRPQHQSRNVQQPQLRLPHGQEERQQAGQLQTLAGRSGPAEVQEPWLGSLERIFEFLVGCCATRTEPDIRGAAAAAFRQLLAGIPAEHLRQMRCTHGGLAHLLVTPPRSLPPGASDRVQPPQDPDEGIAESEAVDLIKAVVERLRHDAGGDRRIALQQWSEMVGVADARYGATAVHRAARYGHRLRVLEEWILPYASRGTLLQPSGHVYLCYHSAARSGREQATNLLLAAVTGALLDLARAPSLQSRLSKLLLSSPPAASAAVVTSSVAAGGSATGGSAAAAAVLEEQLLSTAIYTLKNKFFMGRNELTEGYRSPPGRSGHELLIQGCAAGWAGRKPPAAAAAEVVLPYGPSRPFPSPAPDKKRMAVLLGSFRFAAMELDEAQPCMLQQQHLHALQQA